MSRREDLTLTLPSMRQGTTFLLDAVHRLDDEELRRPSGLPGWSRAHVVGHLARNAEALGRLAEWARTGGRGADVLQPRGARTGDRGVGRAPG